MAINLNLTKRDYLFGRLLATIELWERQAIKQKELTQAEILLQQYVGGFAIRPLKFFTLMFERSLRARKKLKIELHKIFDEEIKSIMSLFRKEDFCDKKIEAEYILGYYHQKSYLLSLYKLSL